MTAPVWLFVFVMMHSPGVKVTTQIPLSTEADCLAVKMGVERHLAMIGAKADISCKLAT